MFRVCLFIFIDCQQRYEIVSRLLFFFFFFLLFFFFFVFTSILVFFCLWTLYLLSCLISASKFNSFYFETSTFVSIAQSAVSVFFFVFPSLIKLSKFNVCFVYILSYFIFLFFLRLVCCTFIQPDMLLGCFASFKLLFVLRSGIHTSNFNWFCLQNRVRVSLSFCQTFSHYSSLF